MTRIKIITIQALFPIVGIALWLGPLNTSFSQTDRAHLPAPGQANQPFNQKQKIVEIEKAIAGRENKPAEEVFKNIQMLKGVPAGRLLKIMEFGYGKSLGVDCTHCHVVDQWEKEDKPTKQITREMSKMASAIINDYLKKIPNLKSDNPIINCTTCHRGQTKPALNMP